MTDRVGQLTVREVSDAECTPHERSIPLGEEEASSWALHFALLADPVRLRLLSALCATDEPICACDLVSPLERSQPTVSHHLKVLSDGGFVRSERQGRWIHYVATDEGRRAFDIIGGGSGSRMP